MDPVALIRYVIELAQGPGTVDARLNLILKATAEALSFEIAVFYRLDLARGRLIPDQSSLGAGYVTESGEFAPGIGIVGACVDEKRVLRTDVPEESRSRSWLADFPIHNVLIAVPVTDGESLAGVMLLLGNETPAAGDLEQVLTVIGRQTGGMLRSSEAQEELQNVIGELSSLYDVSRVANSTLELETLMNMILEEAVRVVGAPGGVLRLLDSEQGAFQVTATQGESRSVRLDALPDIQICRAVQTGRPFRHGGDHAQDSCHALFGCEAEDCLCIPLIEKDRTLGILTIFGRAVDDQNHRMEFSDKTVRLLETIAGMAAGVLAQAVQYRKNERLVVDKETAVRELSIMHVVAKAMMQSTDMEQLLRVMLLALTLGEGLGFNRAMCLLVDEGNGVLEGKAGIGPGSAEDAGRVWIDMTQHSRTLSEWLDWVGEQDIWAPSDPVDQIARRISVPLYEERCLLVRILKTNKAVRLSPKKDYFGIELLDSLEMRGPVACAPIEARGQPLGVILADNIYSQEPIQDESLRFLELFASTAGLAIQNVLLYEGLKNANRDLQSMQEKLIHSERLAALGEFSASMAHEIRNPLVSIGGYARLMQKKHRNSYSRIICEEVARLEDILNQILEFSRSKPLEWQEENLNRVLQSILQSLRGEIVGKHIKIETSWMESLPTILCDGNQIKQVFLNLFHNAIDAMKGRGTLTIKTFLASNEGGFWAVSEISDTGGGIPAEAFQNIFNPFFTTKVRGTGLGLAVTQRIVEAHGGKIEVKNEIGLGSTFRVLLPLP
jgi:two-component system sensor histidine kinase HydH